MAQVAVVLVVVVIFSTIDFVLRFFMGVARISFITSIAYKIENQVGGPCAAEDLIKSLSMFRP